MINEQDKEEDKIESEERVFETQKYPNLTRLQTSETQQANTYNTRKSKHTVIAYIAI